MQLRSGKILGQPNKSKDKSKDKAKKVKAPTYDEGNAFLHRAKQLIETVESNTGGYTGKVSAMHDVFHMLMEKHHVRIVTTYYRSFHKFIAVVIKHCDIYQQDLSHRYVSTSARTDLDTEIMDKLRDLLDETKAVYGRIVSKKM